MKDKERPAIPVTIISGFLGAGKTTLLNELLRGGHGLHIGVLINDFGDINIDAELVETVDEDVIQLSNGCICCSIREDLLGAVLGVLERTDRPDYLVIEASGIADPSAIAFTFSTPGIRETVRLDAVVTVVDCEQILAPYPEDVRQLLEDQVRSAQIVVLNKVDLVDERRIGEIEGRLHEVAPNAMLLKSTYGRLPASLLLDVFRAGDLEHASHSEKPAFQTWSFESAQPIASLRALNHALRQLPEGIVRVKGFLFLEDMPDRQIVLHRVGKRTDVYPGKHWGEAVPRTQLVAVGLPGIALPEGLEAFFTR